MKNIFSLVMLSALLAAFPHITHAGTTLEPPDGFKGHVLLGLGGYGILDSENAADIRLEYRPDHTYWPKHGYLKNLKPWAGLEITSDASFWGGGGFLYDWGFAEKWHIIPSLGAGLYFQGSSDLDLSHTVQFRSQLELAYDLENNNRIGLAFSHISNAGIGDSNPGTEVLNLYYHLGF